MKKKIILILMHSFLLGKLHSQSLDPDLLPDPTLLDKGPGVHILPLKEIYQNKPQDKVKAMIENLINYDDYLFVEDPSDIIHLMSIDKTPQLNTSYYTATISRDYTGLRKELNLIPLGFSVQDFKLPADLQILGYAPAGTLKSSGWTGFLVVFKSDQLGKCTYQLNNVALGKSAVYLAEEYVKYLINRKPSQYSVIGNENYGFKYSVSWYDNDYFRTLECAKSHFASEMKSHLFELAEFLDTSFPNQSGEVIDHHLN